MGTQPYLVLLQPAARVWRRIPDRLERVDSPDCDCAVNERKSLVDDFRRLFAMTSENTGDQRSFADIKFVQSSPTKDGTLCLTWVSSVLARFEV